MNNRICIWISLLILFLSGCGDTAHAYFEETAETTEEILPEATEVDASKAQAEENCDICYVYVCGAVKNPGVYQLMQGSRIYEAILQAGGLTENASSDSINQAEEVSDGQMIKVLTIDEALQTDQQKEVTKADGRVNINTADAGELMTLPGIGESKANSIISYREKQGRFQSIEELMNITGIKEGVYSKIKDDITVD